VPDRPGNHEPTIAGPLIALIVVVVVVLLALPACSKIRHPFSSGGVKTRTGTLVAAPPSGPVGTAFALTAGGFKPGESMTFEIDIPKTPVDKFVGPPHAVGPDGTVTTTYTPLRTSGDPPGVYQLKATGNEGTHAQATLTVT
jgi:hypothetical protein